MPTIAKAKPAIAGLGCGRLCTNYWRQVDHEVRWGVGRGPVYIGELAQVVVLDVGHEDLGRSGLPKAAHDRGAQEARAAGDHDPPAFPEGAHARAVLMVSPRNCFGSSPTSRMSASTMIRTSSVKLVFGRQPSFSAAFEESPQSSSTSVG